MALVVLREIGLYHISKNVSKNILLMDVFRQFKHAGSATIGLNIMVFETFSGWKSLFITSFRGLPDCSLQGEVT